MLKQLLLLTLVTFLTSMALLAQPAAKNFYEISRPQNDYYKQAGKKAPGYKQWKRWEWYYSTRTGESGAIVNNEKLNREALEKSSANRNTLLWRTDANTGSWSPLGPTSVNSGDKGIGRVNRIAFHPTDANTLYVAGATGGLWITTDGGSNWYSYSEGIPNMSLTGVAVDYINPNIIYILTGDADAAFGSPSGVFQYGKSSIGVLKSYDGGFTWYKTGLRWLETDGMLGYKLLMHPLNPLFLLVATNKGIYRTTDGGANWALTTASDPFFDMEFQPGNSNIVYASGTAADSIVVIKSTNIGASFAKTHGIKRQDNFDGDGVSNRSALAVSAANSSYVYLLAGPCTAASEFQGFYRSTDAGESFTLRTNTPNILGATSGGTDKKDQHWYDLSVAANPTNINRVACGGIRLWTSTNGGSSFTWQDDNASASSYYHPDVHDLAYHPLDNSKLYMCADGGVYLSTNNGADWTSVSGNLSLTQYYKIAANPGVGLGVENIVIGGTQDNGTNKRGSGGSSTFSQILGSDGMDCLIDPDGLSTYIASAQNGVFHYSTNAGSSFGKFADSGIVAGYINRSITDRWLTPVAEVAGGTTQFILGYQPAVLATNVGGVWVFTDIGWSGLTITKTARANSNRIYIGDNNRLGQNLIKTSTNLGSTWSTVLSESNTTPVTDLAFDPTNGNRIWITYGNYNAAKKVRFTTDGGVNWTYINGSLPNVPINCILYDGSSGAAPDAIYVGTDIGVFYRDNNLADWIPFSNGLPVVEVTDLDMHPTLGLLRAGTYGRGMWETSRYSNCPSTINLNTSNTAVFKPYYFQASTAVNSTAQHYGTGANVFYKGGTEVVLTPGFAASGDGENVFEAVLGPCGGGVPNKVQSNAAQRIRGVLMD